MHNLSYKSLFLIVVFLLIPIVFLLRLQTAPKSVLASWWNDSWTYRQAITITVSSSASDITDLDTNLSIGTSSLVASGKLQSDCDDLRFTDISGNILPYFIDSGCNTSTTKIWVRANLVPKNTTTYTVYVYYGNPGASSASSSSTFNLYNGLIGYWNFNENTGTSAADLSVNSNTGTMNSTGWSSGKYSIGTSYNGSSSYINSGTLPSLNTTNQMTVSAWFNTTNNAQNGALVSRWQSTGQATNSYVIYLGQDGSHNKVGFYIRQTNGTEVTVRPSTTYNANTWNHIVGVANGTNITLYLNGINIGSTLYDGTILNTSRNLLFGKLRDGDNIYSYNGLLDDVRVYNRALASEEITKLYNTPGSITNISSTISKPTVSFATEETGGGPVAWWKLDEGAGTTAFDASGKNNHGLISGATWQTSNQCIADKCLYFDGSNDLVTTPNNSTLHPNQVSVSAWIKLTGAPNSTHGASIISKKDGTNNEGTYEIVVGSNYEVFFRTDGLSDDTVSSSTNTLQLNRWHFITGVFDGNSIKIYVDGNLKQSDTSTGTLFYTSDEIFIGRRGSAATGFFPGYIDDVRIYPYARSASQIKADYTSGLAGQSSSNSSTNIGSNSSKSLSDGLIAYWKFDEGVGTSSIDSSGNSNTAIFTGTSAPTWSSGKYGVGMSFDRSNDYFNTTLSNINGTAGDYNSVSYWMYWKGNSNDIVFSFGAYYDLWFNSSTCFGFNTGAGEAYGFNPTNLANKWVHVVANFYNGAYTGKNEIYIDGVKQTLTQCAGSAQSKTLTTSLSFILGNLFTNGGYSFGGSIDEFRIYNRALSPTEVKKLYEYAPGPVGYWKFEEASGTTAYDSSGSNRHASLQNGAVFSNGKYGKALGLNLTGAANQWASFTSLSHNYGFTKSAWIYPISTSQCGETRCSVIGPYFEILSNLQYYDNNLSPVGWKTGGSIPLNQWSYITVSNDDSFLKLFVNGIQVQSVGITNTGAHSSNAIGAYSSNMRNFHGLIDEVKIYDYARSTKQILEDMGTGTDSKAPFIYYKFDEGFNTTANNSGVGSSLYKANLGSGSSSPTWIDGKSNKGLRFDGSNDYANLNSIYFPNNNNFTLTGWFNIDTGTTAIYDLPIFGNYQYTSMLGYVPSSKSFQQLRQHSSGSYTITWPNTYQYADSQWHYVAVSIDQGTTSASLYLDGKFSSTRSIGGTEGYSHSNGALRAIGRNYGVTFAGSLDEMKVYNYALSADEIKQDYNQSSTTKVGQSAQTIGATTTNLEYCIPGDTSPCASPVAEWKFEEGTGTTAFDSSGTLINNLPLLTGNSSPAWSNGKTGKALYFDGNDAIGYNNLSVVNITGPITVNAWIKTNTTTSGGIACRYGNSGSWTYCLYMNSTGKLVFLRSSQVDNWSTAITSTNSINDDRWHYVTGRFDGSTMKVYIDSREDGSVNETRSSNSSLWSFCIGNQHYLCDGTSYNGHFTGLIDHVRIYNYARTPAQIAYDYNKGEPIAWWKLDECQGSTAYDSSGIGNTGSINIGVGGSQTSIGTCTTSGAWFNGTSGKNNSSLSFDGTDDYINTSSITPTTSGTSTVSLWAKLSSSNDGKYLFSGIGSCYQRPAVFDSSSHLGFYNGTSYVYGSKNFNDNNFHHIVIVDRLSPSRSRMIYVDGVIDIAWNDLSGAVYGANTCYINMIGGYGGSSAYFQGQLDDIRIYNYALTSNQVKTLYSGGALNFR